MSDIEPLTAAELALQKRWLDEIVEPHLDNGGQVTAAIAMVLVSALRQAHVTIDNLLVKLETAQEHLKGDLGKKDT